MQVFFFLNYSSNVKELLKLFYDRKHYRPLRNVTVYLFDWFDSLRPDQQFFSYNGTGLPGLNQY